MKITHSGKVWTAIGKTAQGWLIWPVEEYFARRSHTPNVEARIRRLNPNGLVEGQRIRGLHPSYRFRGAGRRAKRGKWKGWKPW